MNISVTDSSTSEDNEVVNVVGSISSKDIKNTDIRKYCWSLISCYSICIAFYFKI